LLLAVALRRPNHPRNIMNKIHAAVALSLLALSAGAFAQDADADAARQRRMDEAYADAHHESSFGATVRADTHRAGRAIDNGLHKTGHAIERGARATGHAIHRGVDKVTGK
jgi:hypothetical protein